MSTSPVARVSPGVPAGGQFAANSHAEPSVCLTGEPSVVHGMLPGSHERSGGPECRCGRAWNYGAEQCASMPKPTRPAPVAKPRRSSFALFGWAIQRQVKGANVLERRPERPSDTERLLRNSRGEKDGQVRRVYLDCRSMPATREVEVVGPKDGRPIIIDVASGMIPLKVTSGKALIHSDSSWGNAVTVANGAEATVVASDHSKVTLVVENGGKATFISESGDNRLRPTTHGSGTLHLVVNDDEPILYDQDTRWDRPAPHVAP